MYQKQNTNDFIAFKCLFDSNLLQFVQDNNIQQIETILKTTYDTETNNNYYVSVPINITEINNQYEKYVQEIENDPSLIYKL